MGATKSIHSLWYKVLGGVKAAAQNRKVGQSLQRVTMASRRLRGGLLGMRSMLMGAGAGMVALGMGAMRVVREFERYTEMQSQVRTTLAAQGLQSRRATAMTIGYAESIGRDLGYSLSEASEGMNTLLQTGQSVHEAMRLYPSTMRLARVANMDMARATRFLVDTTQMFRQEMVENDETLQQFSERMSGQLAVAAYTTATNVEDLQQAFRYAGPEMSALGYSSREVMSALAGLSTMGLRSTTAGTRLRGAMLAMHRSTNPLNIALRAQGIEAHEISEAWYDAQGNIRPFYDGMARMADITSRVTSQQARNTIQMHLFGRRAFAGGQLVSGLTQMSVRARRAYEAMEDPLVMNTRLMAMEQERMRSFGMQMQQLRHGANDLAIGFGQILFGAMDRSGEGFGTWFRNLSAGVMILNEMEEGTDGATDRFNELTPSIRRQSRELRQLFQHMANGLRWMGRMTVHIARFIEDYPRWTIAIIALRIALGAGGLGRALRWTSRQLLVFNARLLASRTACLRTRVGLGMMSAGFAVLGLAIVNELMPHVVNLTTNLTGQSDAYRQLQRATQDQTRYWREQIPVIGNIVAAYIELWELARQTREVTQETRERRRETMAETVAHPRAAVRTRAAAMGEQSRWATTPDEELHHRAALGEASASIQRFAAISWTGGTRTEEAISTLLRQHGLQEDQTAEYTRHIMRIHATEGETLRRTAISLVGHNLAVRRSEEITRMAARQLAGLGRAAEEATQYLEAGGTSHGPHQSYGAGLIGPPVEDAYIRQGGLISVSGGDVVVSRRHLANAMTASAGALAGPSAPFQGERPMVGPSPTGGGGGGGGGDIVIPLIVDGREIARAVGRAEIDQVQRGGGSFRPGDRRAVRETGFRRPI